MALLGLLQKKSGRPAEAAPDVAVEVTEKERKAEGPPLLVLVPDISGMSSFRLHRFTEAGAGAAFIHERVRPEVRQGIHAFWALPARPNAESEHPGSPPGEALVLIRTRENSGVVYVVSFVDIESAQSFARFEARRGLHPQLIMIYWAVIVNIRQELEGVTIFPSCPPALGLSREAVEPVAVDLAVEPVAVVDLEEAPRQQEISIAEAEAEATAAAYLHQMAASDLMVEESAPDAAPARAEEPAAAEVLNGLAVAPTMEEADEQAPEVSGLATAEEPAPSWRLDAPVQTYAGDEELADRHLEVFSPVEGEPYMVDDAAAFMSASENSVAGPEIRSGDFNIEAEVERFLRQRRSERRDGPFQGFHSPPGRF